MSYNEFVKTHFHSVQGATPQDRMRAVGALWRQHKAGKGGNFFDDVLGTVKAVTKLAPLIGLGMEKKKRVRKSRAKKADKAGSLLGSIIPFGSLLGLGMKKKKTKGGELLDTQLASQEKKEIGTGGVMNHDDFKKVLEKMQKKFQNKKFIKKHAETIMKGGSWGDNELDRMVNGLSYGFKLPFQALSSIFG